MLRDMFRPDGTVHFTGVINNPQFLEVMYVAGPYRGETIHDIMQNIGRAREAAVALWKAGYCVICPHLNSALMDGAVEDEAFLTGGLELVRRADTLVLLEGWQDSKGTIQELLLANSLHKRILLYTENGLEPFNGIVIMEEKAKD